MKIETVGKVYMAAFGLKIKSGLKQPKSTNKCMESLRLAIDFQQLVNETLYGRPEFKQKIQIKIGIHYGRVLAGVIGFHKPQFSLIGDTVNTTSRLCSNADSG